MAQDTCTKGVDTSYSHAQGRKNIKASLNGVSVRAGKCRLDRFLMTGCVLGLFLLDAILEREALQQKGTQARYNRN